MAIQCFVCLLGINHLASGQKVCENVPLVNDQVYVIILFRESVLDGDVKGSGEVNPVVEHLWIEPTKPLELFLEVSGA